MPGIDNLERIAIVGIGGIFPGAPDLATFWRNIAAGVDAGRHVPTGRWYLSPEKAFAPWPPKPDRVYSTWGCFIENFALDPADLNIDRGLLSKLDPMFHLGLHAARAAFADAGGLTGVDRARVGVILGNIALPTESTSSLCRDVLGRTFLEKLIDTAANAASARRDIDASPASVTKTLADPAVAASLKSSLRRSHWHSLNRFAAGLPASLIGQGLGLGGIAFTLDAACASSLYSLKFAAEELLSHRADAMLAGGMSRPDCQYTQMGFSQLKALSRRGCCAPLSAEADGLVVGEGAGVFVLKRLTDAIAANDHIYGVIAGIGLSNDRGANLLAPHSDGQLRAMRAAYQQAGWNPSQVDLIECHATGTPVGDAVEISSLHQLWEGETARPRQCVIGGVKSNVGHLLTGAGAAGLMKVLLALKHQTLPPTANFTRPAEKLADVDSPFRVLRQAEAWGRRTTDRNDVTPRRATINAFGFGGINAHVLVEEWIAPNESPPDRQRVSAGPSAPEVSASIVGLDAHLGGWESRDAIRQNYFNGRSLSATASNDWGVKQTDWFRGEHRAEVEVIPVNEVRLPMAQFRIPPLEMQDMLPQQQLMLKVAAGALQDARDSHASSDGTPKAADQDALSNRTGVFIGIELDPNTTNFHFRWSIEQDAPQWALSLGLDLSPDQLEEWVQELKDAAGPPLTPNRVMGNLGGIVASRLAREFDVGGPSFTISAGRESDAVALHLALGELLRGELDRAIVGGVELATDPRWNGLESDGASTQSSVSPDAAYALVLKRTGDALSQRNRTYGTILPPAGQTVDSHGGHPGLNDLSRQFPDSGGALNHPVIPTLEVYFGLSRSAQAWESFPAPSGARASLVIRRKRDRLRQFLFHRAVRPDLQYGVQEPEATHPKIEADRRRPFGPLPLGLLVVDGGSPQELGGKLKELRESSRSAATVESLAVTWFQRYPHRFENRYAVVLTPRTVGEMPELIELASKRVHGSPSASQTEKDKQVYYSETSLGRAGRVAFVFPGSGNAFRGMGQALFSQFQDVLRQHQSENDDLPGQFGAGPFLRHSGIESCDANHKSMIFSQVAIGAAVCDLLAHFKVRPSASIGYSLGESAALFGLRAWAERDEMLRRMQRSTLFGSDLVAPFDAARAAWNVSPTESVPWVSGIVDRSAAEVQSALDRLMQNEADRRLSLLIVNTPSQCVVGGDRGQVERLVRELQAGFVPLASPSTVHCDVLRQVEESYRQLHWMQTTAPVVTFGAGTVPIDFYSTAWGVRYELTRQSAAEAIVAQAVHTIDFPRVIEQAYADGVRTFIEIGPGSSCTRMITEILGEKPHLARAALPVTSRPLEAFLELLAALIAERVPVDLSYLYGDLPEQKVQETAESVREVVTRVGGLPFQIPGPPGGWHFDPAATAASFPAPLANLPVFCAAVYDSGCHEPVEFSPPPAWPSDFPKTVGLEDDFSQIATCLWNQLTLMNDQRTQAHEAFLRLCGRLERLTAEQLAQLSRAEVGETASHSISMPMRGEQHAVTNGEPPFEERENQSAAEADADRFRDSLSDEPPTALNRQQCMEFAIGRIGNVLGRRFAEIDRHPTRVRLPDEPLMLVDRILAIEGEPLSMTSGRVVTEHDIHPGAWYLDCGRIPTCIAVESGQADLFLSGWLGIDFQTKGLACYRLLDAVVTFHDALPQAGKTIHYDIRVLHFFRQGETYLFRFEFDATVDGRPLLTMREGCAGFFTQQELAGGKGIVHTALDKRPRPGVRPADWREPVPLAVESYSDQQILALRRGNLAECFGTLFSKLPIKSPVTLPGLEAQRDSNNLTDRKTRMWLVDRILKLDPHGGKFGIGLILGELDIHPDDWFLTCHFCDDQVMPGTLMYECCLQTLRIYLLRMGWIGESGQVVYEPIPEIRSRLKCRGQVLAGTKKVWYEVTLKEVGYSHGGGDDPSAYCLADALMYADGKPIVEITDMSVRLSGLTKPHIDRLWSKGPRYDRRPALFDTERITAFAIGNPSYAFGDRYQPFDSDRKIARLPGPPFQFLDRIVSIKDCQAWVLQAGGEIVAQYDVPPDARYFASNRQPAMPFAVLLETALQPCGWLAAYLGSALTSDIDLSFRNLGGSATQFREVTPQSGTLTTTVKMTGVSNSAGMIIQHYDFDLRCDGLPVYSGTTYFGFFSKAALSNQVGIREATPYQPTPAETITARRMAYPVQAPFPDDQFRMIQTVESLSGEGGPYGKGFIIGTMPVDPSTWFFKAHFYQDPVVPGSLGLESFWQLLKVFAVDRWSLGPAARFRSPSLQADAATNSPPKHEWVYRGQVVPRDCLVTVTAVIRDCDDSRRSLTAEGYLSVDGRVIYQMKNFILSCE